MKISYLLLVAVMAVPFSGIARSDAPDSWYKPGQHFIKMSVTETGWYHCPASQLASAGFPVYSDSIRYLQLFRRGRELALQEIWDETGRFSGVEFYGEKNDGALDSSLYISAAAQPQTFLSLYADTAAYFLTYGTTTGKRIEQLNGWPGNEKVQPYFFCEETTVLTKEYTAGNIYPMGATYENGVILTTYDEGEGYCGPLQTDTGWQEISLPFRHLSADHIQQATARLTFMGRKAGKHQVEIIYTRAGEFYRKGGEITWENFQTKEIELNFEAGDADEAHGITLRWRLTATGGGVSLMKMQWIYPQRTDTLKEFESQYLISKIPPEGSQLPHDLTNVRYFNITDPYHCKEINVNGFLAESDGKVLAVANTLTVNMLKMVEFEDRSLLKTEFLIITHPLLRTDPVTGDDPVRTYAEYRSSAAGGNYRTLVMNIDEVFDRFHYGERSPQAIRNLIRLMTDYGRLQLVFLIGRSKDPQTVRFLKNGWKEDLIPNAGWPGSDMSLGMTSTENPFPMVGIGRLFVSSPHEVTAYLKKVTLMESEANSAIWRKNVLHLSGGHSVAEREIFRSYTAAFADRITDSSVGLEVESKSKQTEAEVEKVDISGFVNQGVALVTAFGHSSLNQADLDFGRASDIQNGFMNSPAFPAFWVNGCAMGNMYFRGITLSTDWINAPERGAVLFVAHSHNGATPGLKRYTDALYETLADAGFISMPFGIIMKEAATRYLNRFPWLTDVITVQQMNLQGDPAIRIFPATKPDLQWTGTEPSVYFRSDTLFVAAEALNSGRYWEGDYTVRISVSKDGVLLYHDEGMRRSISLKDAVVSGIPVTAMKPTEPVKIQINLDPDDQVKEELEDNNEITFMIDPADYIPIIVSEVVVMPNPFSDQATFRIQVIGKSGSLKGFIEFYDTQGQKVDTITQDLVPGVNDIIWKPAGISSATYIYKLSVTSTTDMAGFPEKKYYQSGKLVGIF